MIYDHISNIPLYKGLTPALDTALDFIAAAPATLAPGTTLLDHGVKAIVSEYTTKQVNPKGYEAHRKYADIQFLLDGKEVLKCCPLPLLDPTTEYDEAADCRFYGEKAGEGIDLRLGGGYFAVVFPEDAHIPQLAVEEPEAVKKVVMKVPVE